MQVIANARALGARLMKYGYKLVTDGTDNHLVLWDMRKEVMLCPSFFTFTLKTLGSLVPISARLTVDRSVLAVNVCSKVPR